MSISTTTTKDSYAGNASIVTAYPITFKYLEDSHITVYVDGVALSNSYYTLTGDGSLGTGQFTTAVAYADTKKVVVVLDVPFDQPVELLETGALSSSTLEEAYDRLNMQIRRVWRSVQNTLTFSTDEGGSATQGTAGKLLGFNSGGNLTEVENTAGTIKSTSHTYDIKATDSDDLVTPNARGEGSIDLQTKRTLATDVASGVRSVLVGGASNTASNTAASVIGGQTNKANSINSTVIGGEGNVAGVGNDSGIFSSRDCSALNSLAVVVGALNSTASGGRSSCLGGEYNNAIGNSSTVVGGKNGESSGVRSIVLGGEGGKAEGEGSTVVGSYASTASGLNAGVFSSMGSTASGVRSVVVGALDGTAQGGRSSCLGGEYNDAIGNSSTVVGGKDGTTNGERSMVLGGEGNTANGEGSGVLCSKFGTADGSNAVILGGESVIALGLNSAVVGGVNSEANGARSAVVAGDGGKTNNDNAVVLGGFNGQANGLRSCSIGGTNNIATGNDSLVSGAKAQAVNAGSRMFADSQDTLFQSRQVDEFGIQASALRLEDGNEGVGKVLTCNHADGSSNWSVPSRPVYNYVDLPSSPQKGDIAILNDSNTTTWHAIAGGGGIHVIPVYFSGGSWRIG